MKWVSMAEQLHTSLKSPCAMPSISWSGVKLAAIGLWSSGNAFSGVMNHASPSCSPNGRMPGESYLPQCFWWFGLGPLVSVKGNLNATAYYNIHCIQFCASNIEATVWGRPLPVSAWQCPRAQSEGRTELGGRGRCKRTWLACTESWPHQTPLGWIGTQTASQA